MQIWVIPKYGYWHDQWSRSFICTKKKVDIHSIDQLKIKFAVVIAVFLFIHSNKWLKFWSRRNCDNLSISDWNSSSSIFLSRGKKMFKNQFKSQFFFFIELSFSTQGVKIWYSNPLDFLSWCWILLSTSYPPKRWYGISITDSNTLSHSHTFDCSCIFFLISLFVPVW